MGKTDKDFQWLVHFPFFFTLVTERFGGGGVVVHG